MPAHAKRPEPRAAIRVLIADDHPIVRSGLRRIAESACDVEVVGEAATADEALALAGTCPCEAIVLDLAMPGAIGLSLLKDLRRVVPDVPVLILSMSPEDQFAIRALKAGAAGYLSKRSAAEQLVDAIRRIVAGGLHVSATIGRQLAEEMLRPESRRPAGLARLSDRELEVLQLFASGMSVTRIARELTLSVKTISTHRARVLTKLGLDSNASLIRYAIEERLIET